MRVLRFFFAAYFLIPALLFSTSVSAEDQDSIHFRDVPLAEGLKMAQAENKPVFLMGFASWCEHCAKMKSKVFHEKAVADFFNAHFVCIKKDMEKEEGIMLHNRFHVKSYPAYIFLDANGTTLYQAIGERTDTTMIELGKTALNPAKRFPTLKDQFERNISNSDSCFTYVYALRSGMLDCSEPASKHLATQTDEQLLTSANWKIIANCIMDINSREIQFVLRHQKEYGAIASPLRVERKIVNLAEELLSPSVTSRDSNGYFRRRPLAEGMHHPKVDSLLFKYDLNIYDQLGNWDLYRKTADASTMTFAKNDASTLKEISNNYAAYVTDTASLLMAANWVKRAIQLNDEYNLYITGAKLYQKAGDKKSAIEMAQNGKDLAMKYGFNHADADALLIALQR